MKTSLTKLSSSFLLLSLSFTAWAKPVAQVIEVKGAVFVVTAEGQTKALKLHEHIEDKSEVMVEEGASITLNDYYDATYHLIGGSHLKFFNKSVQLKKGKTWIQSMNSKHPLALTTANGHVDYSKGEFITTFDHVTNRSQFLVVNGDVEVSNILDKNMKYTVSAGTFSMVDPDVENGLPRSPTKVGLQSLNAALSEFKKLPEQIKNNVLPARAIASTDMGEAPAKRGEIIWMTTTRKPASVAKGSAHKYFKKAVSKSSVSQPVPIKIYGLGWKDESPAAPRRPASISTKVPTLPKTQGMHLKLDHEFQDSLKDHSIQQPKYSKELENLIQDLKSY